MCLFPRRRAEGKAWIQTELEKLVKGLRLYGKDYYKIADLIGTKSVTQINTKIFVTTKRKDPSHMLEEEKELVKIMEKINPVDYAAK